MPEQESVFQAKVVANKLFSKPANLSTCKDCIFLRFAEGNNKKGELFASVFCGQNFNRDNYKNGQECARYESLYESPDLISGGFED